MIASINFIRISPFYIYACFLYAYFITFLIHLQIYIKENGYTEEYQNGKNQWGTKRSPQAEQYNTMVKNYTAIIGKLNDLIPKDKTSTNDIDDGFDDFINDKE